MRNFGLAIVEAIITLVITQIPIFLGLVVYALDNKNATFNSSLSAMMQNLSYGDVLSYSAGILASSTAYALMKIGSFKIKPLLMIFLILFPILAIMAAMPIYIQDTNNQINNAVFAGNYVKGVLLVSIVLWIHALYQSRAFFEITTPNNSASDKIVRNIEGS